MTEAELLAEITAISTAINNIMITGQKYEIGTGSSKRIYEYADLNSLREYRRELQRDLVSLTDGGGGVLLGF